MAITITLFKCPVCARLAKIPLDTPRVFCACGYRQENGPTPGLGDYLAAGFHRIGLTPKHYVAVKKWLGLQPTCNCPQRQAAWNAAGRRLGIGRPPTPPSPPPPR